MIAAEVLPVRGEKVSFTDLLPLLPVLPVPTGTFSRVAGKDRPANLLASTSLTSVQNEADLVWQVEGVVIHHGLRQGGAISQMPGGEQAMSSGGQRQGSGVFWDGARHGS